MKKDIVSVKLWKTRKHALMSPCHNAVLMTEELQKPPRKFWCYVCTEYVSGPLKSSMFGLICAHHTRAEIEQHSPTPPHDPAKLAQNRQMAGIFQAYDNLEPNDVMEMYQLLRRRFLDKPTHKGRNVLGEKIAYLARIIDGWKQERGQIRKPFYKSRK